MSLSLLTNLDGLLITDFTNIRYLTGFVGASPEEREAYVLLTNNSIFLFTNSLYKEAAQKLSNTPIEFIEISREHPISKKLGHLVKKLGIKKLGFEKQNLTVAEFEKLQNEVKGVTLVPTKNRIEQLRMIKRPDEIEYIRQAAKITDACFDYLLGEIKPGITESEIAWKIESFLRNQTPLATLAFSPIVAFGKNTSQPHYSIIASTLGSGLKKPQGQTLSRPDIVLLDFGARVNGYCADMTRVVFVGKPRDEWVKAYGIVLKAQQRAIDLLKDGVRSGASLDATAKKIIAEADLPPYPHSLGHNVGLAVHEGPRLSVKKDEALKLGMVFSIEPGVYIEGQFGIRIEDLVLLEKNRIEILSHSSKEAMQL